MLDFNFNRKGGKHPANSQQSQHYTYSFKQFLPYILNECNFRNFKSSQILIKKTQYKFTP